MIRSFFIKNRLYIISVIILIVCASFFSYYTSGNTCTNLRVKKMKEIQFVNAGSYDGINSNIELQEFVNSQNMGEATLKKLLCNKELLTLFFILIIILSFYQFSLYIRGCIIRVSQSINKFFMMHYLHLKDGKKNALSCYYSF